MTPKIKQGNSVPVKFTVMENGEQKDMSAATDLAWTIRHAEYGCRRTPSIVIEGGSNPYTIVVKTTVENLLGNYFLALSYTENGESRSVDAKAFELAAHSAPCSCLGASEAICLSADTCIGARGPAGTIEAVTASVDNTEGAPDVEVELGGTPEMRTIGFRFSGLKSTDGISAYEIAVQNGFIGTEAEWLESLRIPQNLIHSPGEREDAAMSQKGATELASATLATADKHAEGLASAALTEANHYTDEQIAAIPVPDVSRQIGAHNASGVAHADLRGVLRGKVDAVPGEGLSTNDYTNEEKAEVAKIAGKEDAQILEHITGSVVTLDVLGGHTYLCGELASLVIRSVEDSPRSGIIRFRSGAVATSLTLPDTLRVVGYARPEVNRDYELDIANGLAYINRF